MTVMEYDRRQANRLIPLLRSVAVEMHERGLELRRLEWLQGELSKTERAHRHDLNELQAEIASNKYELRRSHQELESLGCQVESDEPLSIRIPARRSTGREGFVWRMTQPQRLFDVADSAA